MADEARQDVCHAADGPRAATRRYPLLDLVPSFAVDERFVGALRSPSRGHFAFPACPVPRANIGRVCQEEAGTRDANARLGSYAVELHTSRCQSEEHTSELQSPD